MLEFHLRAGLVTHDPEVAEILERARTRGGRSAGRWCVDEGSRGGRSRARAPHRGCVEKRLRVRVPPGETRQGRSGEARLAAVSSIMRSCVKTRGRAGGGDAGQRARSTARHSGLAAGMTLATSMGPFLLRPRRVLVCFASKRRDEPSAIETTGLSGDDRAELPDRAAEP